jgi:hypothetical protein
MMRWIGYGLIMVAAFTQPFAAFANPDDSEREIQHLMAYIADSDCRFIRNGKEYGAGEAVKHLQGKYEYAGSRIGTAEDFIRYVATKSSMSGEPYKIRCDDQTILCADWLRAELARIRQKE